MIFIWSSSGIHVDATSNKTGKNANPEVVVSRHRVCLYIHPPFYFSLVWFLGHNAKTQGCEKRELCWKDELTAFRREFPSRVCFQLCRCRLVSEGVGG